MFSVFHHSRRQAVKGTSPIALHKHSAIVQRRSSLFRHDQCHQQHSVVVPGVLLDLPPLPAHTLSGHSRPTNSRQFSHAVWHDGKGEKRRQFSHAVWHDGKGEKSPEKFPEKFWSAPAAAPAPDQASHGVGSTSSRPPATALDQQVPDPEHKFPPATALDQRSWSSFVNTLHERARTNSCASPSTPAGSPGIKPSNDHQDPTIAVLRESIDQQDPTIAVLRESIFSDMGHDGDSAVTGAARGSLPASTSTTAPARGLSSPVLLRDGLVKLEKIGRVAKITLNNMHSKNAMTPELASEFQNTIETLKGMLELAHTEENSYSESIGCVVLTGAGDAFSAGGDLKFLQNRVDAAGSSSPVPGVVRESRGQEAAKMENKQTMCEFYEKFLCVRELKVPVVAAVNGSAIGAGACLAMACDVRVIAAGAKIGFTFVGLGLHPGMGATHYLPKVAGREIAFYLLTSGETISGSEAKNFGLCSHVAAHGDACITQAMEIAERICKQGPLAVRQVTETLRDFGDHDNGRAGEEELRLRAALERESDCQSVNYGSEDMAEGLRAVLARRKPDFSKL